MDDNRANNNDKTFHGPFSYGEDVTLLQRKVLSEQHLQKKLF